jgi:hypothetical protein
MTNFRLRKIDLNTESFIDEVDFSTLKVERILTIIDAEIFSPGMSYRINKSEYKKIVEEFGLNTDANAVVAEISNYGDEIPVPTTDHTGRELMLMLQGKKPLAVFCDAVETFEVTFSLVELAFEPFVVSGEIIKYSYVEKSSKKYVLKRILFALPEEAWRIFAYKSIWEISSKYGWRDGFEEIEGYLLGYETEIDTFFKGN